MRNIVVIDCGSGNLHSVMGGLQRAATQASTDTGKEYHLSLTTNAADLAQADKIILPGVGAFGNCMTGLHALPEMHETLEHHVLEKTVPFLGICVGMQMLLERGLEHGEHAGLGWIEGEVVPITPPDFSFKIPHMGWNELELTQPDHPLFTDITPGDHCYFVHSYYAAPSDTKTILATVNYGATLPAAIGRKHIMGVQFHPEKSQHVGQILLKNFLELEMEDIA